MRSFKSFSLAVIIVPFVAMATMVAVNLLLDPYHIFSKGRDYPFIAHSLRYYGDAGVIHNYDMKNIIVGGSLMDNFVPSEVDSALGWRDTYLLTLNDADGAAISAVVQGAMRKHTIKHVLFGLQPERLAEIPAEQEAKRGQGKNFIYLYDDSRLNDLLAFAQVPTHFIKTCLDNKRQRDQLRQSFSGLTDPTIRAASEDLYSTYMPDHYKEFNRPLFISSIADENEPRQHVTDDIKANLAQNFETNIKPLVEQHPTTEFDFVVAPGSFMEKKGNRDIFAYSLAFLVKKLSGYKNAKVYGFANDGFNADLRLYKDLNHFHIEISRFMIQSIAHDDHRLAAENIDAYIESFNRIMDAYHLPALWKTTYYPRRNGPYPKEGYLTYHDAAKLVWGSKFSESLYNSISRSPYLAENSYVSGPIETWPPLNASRLLLEHPQAFNGGAPAACTGCGSHTMAQVGHELSPN